MARKNPSITLSGLTFKAIDDDSSMAGFLEIEERAQAKNSYYNSFDGSEIGRLRDFLNTHFPKKEAKNEH